ncbi:MAG TPA: iron ABC transporter permease [Anaerolineales bacterium]|nr:iron ABC transporter permease [Anaerolineales bacterium]
MRLRRYAPWIWTAGVLLAAILANAAIGAVAIPPELVARMVLARLPLLSIESNWPAAFATILYEIRLPNLVLTGLTGLALGGSGAAFQALFRNPLADPYVIGIASGAGLGAVLAMALRWPADGLGMAAVPVAGFLGALLTVALVYRLSSVGKTTPVTTLILAGVAVSSFATALTSLILLLSTSELHRAVTWMVGGFSLGGWAPVLASLPYLALSLGVLVTLGRPLDVLQFGDEQATQLGLDVDRLKLVVVVTASLAAATAVSFSGIIAFVGLVVPHLTRLLWGPSYRRLLPLAALGGASFLLMADIVARSLLSPRELPVGVVTSVIGAPFFLYLLARAKRNLRAW